MKPPSPPAADADAASGSAETAAPARNFTVSLEQQVRAATAGLPAYIRRKRAIEDLRESILRGLAAHRAVARDVERLRELVGRHNRWYPIEANLPVNPRTGELLERTGEPWRPMDVPTLEELIREAVRTATT